jgi:hypothetical protein
MLKEVSVDLVNKKMNRLLLLCLVAENGEERQNKWGFELYY